MPVFTKYLLILKYFLLISIFTSIYHLYNNQLYTMIILLAFSAILMVNDYIRTNKLTINSKCIYVGSLIFTICGAGILKYFVNGTGTNVYMALPLIELLGLKGLKLKILFSVHLMLFFIISNFELGISQSPFKLSVFQIGIFSN